MLCLRPMGWRHIYFCPICPSVCLSVFLFVCLPVRPFVSHIFSSAITNEPLDGSNLNCRNIFIKMKSWVVYSRPSDSRWPPYSTPFIWHQSWSKTLYWIEMFTSIFFYYVPEVTLQKLKVSKITENYRKSLENSENSRKLLIMPRNRWKWQEMANQSLLILLLFINLVFYIPEATF